ncbi:MAG TPA: transcriptional repressor NrdR [Candidatus Omnitrophica bacterium]|nr:transcriptional repressor NrdR [Candidatus Omnitrophota bacterium]
MKCPFCGNLANKVIDSRLTSNFLSIRRRRECLGCRRRFTTYERIEEVPFMVVKKDGRREPFQREKLLKGILKACEKRPVATEKVEMLVERIERDVKERSYDEASSERIGEMVIEGLKNLDRVAYIRFASVYRQFTDIEDFLKEVEQFSKQRRRGDKNGKIA